MSTVAPTRLVVGITGATGAPIAVRLLEVLRELPRVETHLVLSPWGRTTIGVETPYPVRKVVELADVTHRFGELGATVSSGSYPVSGMVVVPCSMKTLAAIRHGLADNLITRAADVTLKERRPLVLVPRETPLSEIHLENMLALARMGARIVPPMPAFYDNPGSVADIVDHIVMRLLDQLGLPPGETDLAERWPGLGDVRGRD
ncbi:UbiX family flavin prenyltransferase [Embleya hyalina]|uniref:Flavin prenyltransferase UbiX n=1 Tax=Embleya hyalina TaxID=516124 RepID=A0A401YJX7_9ACTN|nr:UbiX family flavin prenyltransferase [Embleya hyalina]GCD94915.1 flavin prenyltransferase UbiX [Embleya hyalina]